MSLLEKPSPGRLLLDDTVPLTAVIEASQILQSHTVSVSLKIRVIEPLTVRSFAVKTLMRVL